MDGDFLKKMGEATQFGANWSSLKNAEEAAKVRELLEQQQEEEQRKAARHAKLPDCPYCGNKLAKVGVKLCGQCREKVAWVGEVPCEPCQEEATRVKIRREEARRQRERKEQEEKDKERQRRRTRRGERKKLERQKKEERKKLERQKKELRHQQWLMTKEGQEYTKQRARIRAQWNFFWVFFGLISPSLLFSVAVVCFILWADYGNEGASEIGLWAAIGLCLDFIVLLWFGSICLNSDEEDPYEKSKFFKPEELGSKDPLVVEPVLDSSNVQVVKQMRAATQTAPSAQTWIKRGERVSGPFSPEHMQKLFLNKKIFEGDMFSNAENGPWKKLPAKWSGL